MKRVIIIIIALLTVSKAYSQNITIIANKEESERYSEVMDNSREQRYDAYTRRIDSLSRINRELERRSDSLIHINRELERRRDRLSHRIWVETNDSIKEELEHAREKLHKRQSEVYKKLRELRDQYKAQMQVPQDSLSGNFIITCEGFLNYTLCNMVCKELLSGEIINGKAEIDARNIKASVYYLEPGLYFLILYGETGSLIQKIIVDSDKKMELLF